MPTEGLYSKATEKGICWACEGKKGFWKEAGDDNMGYPQPRHYRPCTYCNDTGKPGPEQQYKTMLEGKDLCTECEIEVSLHKAQGSPHGCMFALRAVVKLLRQKVGV